MGINYEDEIEQIVFDTFRYMYNIDDNDVIYRYLKLRHRCINAFKKEELNKLCQFILDELYINSPVYKDVHLYLINGYDNSIRNIIDSLEFRGKLFDIIDENNNSCSFDSYIEKTWNDINTQALKNSKNYMKDKYYKYHLIYNRLLLLNEIFGVTEVKEVPTMYGFVQDLTQNLSMEQKCLRYIHASNFDTTNIKSITEEDLEDFLFRNLNLVEEGLKPIRRQVEVEEGRIDILAKDKNDRYVIIELKIANDKHLVWQVMYYPQAIKSVVGSCNPRVITICPSYPNYIKNPLSQVGYVEMIEYQATMCNNKITNINFNKLN